MQDRKFAKELYKNFDKYKKVLIKIYKDEDAREILEDAFENDNYGSEILEKLSESADKQVRFRAKIETVKYFEKDSPLNTPQSSPDSSSKEEVDEEEEEEQVSKKSPGHKYRL